MELTQRKVSPGDMSIVRMTAAEPKFNAGRRVEIKYRDLGLEKATGGDMRAEVMHISTSPSRPTGWHYHTADVQFLHMIKGWVRMEFPDLGVITLGEGDSITIPGGTIHQELTSSNDVELLEITVPAKLQTVNVPAPEWGREKGEAYGEISTPQKAGHSNET